MNDLLEAFQIFAKYTQSEWPTHCEHDVMYVNVSPEIVSDTDLARLYVLGFHNADADGHDQDMFYSYKFGSC